jgi:hypothetical protein
MGEFEADVNAQLFATTDVSPRPPTQYLIKSRKNRLRDIFIHPITIQHACSVTATFTGQVQMQLQSTVSM